MLTKDTSGRYISIKADGKLHETVSRETEGAVFREYETSTGEKGSKWELVYKNVEGYITNIKFEEGDYGENLQITIKDGDEEVTLSEGVGTSFGEDMLKKLPALNFTKRVGFSPYSFENEKGKLIKGVSVYQQSDKVTNFFYDFEKKEGLHGFPMPEGDTAEYKKDDWKIYFLQVRKFLVKYAKENLVSKFPIEVDDISPEDIDEVFDNKVELISVADMDFSAGVGFDDSTEEPPL